MSFTDMFNNIVKLMGQYWYEFLVRGVSITLLLSALTVFFGTILGTLVAMGKMSKFKPLSWLVTAYIEIIRGTPILLQLYIGYFIVPKIFSFMEMSDFTSITIALIINSSAYVSEVIRSGIEAVDKGQTEAARSLGLSSSQTMIKVVLPQAVKNILPSLGNEFIMMIKETSLASTFFIGDIMTSYLKVKGITYLAIECLLIVGMIYFVLTFTLSKVVAIFERKLKHADR